MTPVKIIDERAQMAVREFSRMVPMLTTFVRSVSGRPDAAVQAGPKTATDGRIVYLRPPLALADSATHERAVCDQRGPDHRMVCPACARLEDLYTGIYHEVSHVAAESAKAWPRHRIASAVDAGIQHSGNTDPLFQVRRPATSGAINVLQYARDAHPFLEAWVRIGEEVRVDALAGQARPGVEVMRHHQTEHLLGGVSKGRDPWISRPIEEQVPMAALVQRQGHAIEGRFAPDAVAAVMAPSVQRALELPISAAMEAVTMGAALLGALNALGLYQSPEQLARNEQDNTKESSDDDADDDTQPGDQDAGPDSAGGPDRGPDDGEGAEAGAGEGQDAPVGGGGAEPGDGDGEAGGGAGGDEGAEDPDEADPGSEGGGGAGADPPPCEGGDGASGPAGQAGGADGADDGGGAREAGDADEGSDASGEGGSPGAAEGSPAGAAGAAGPVPEGGGGPGEGLPDPGDAEGLNYREMPMEPDFRGMAPEARSGSAEILGVALEATGHDNDLDSGAASTKELRADKRLSDVMRVAIMQAASFDTPSARVSGVTIRRGGSAEGWGPASGYHRPVEERDLAPSILHARRVFSDSRIDRNVRNVRKGKINPSALGKRAWGKDDRLFRRKLRAEGIDFEVVIGMDISYSTADGCIHLIKQSGEALASVLHRVGVPFSLYAHTTDDGSNATGALGQEMLEIKAPREPWGASQRDLVARLVPTQGSLDGHNLEFYRKILDRSSARKRMIVYFTDGEIPETNHHEERVVLLREVKIINSRGYGVMAVGIGNDSPKKFGLDTVRIDRADDIVTVIKELEKRITN